MKIVKSFEQGAYIISSEGIKYPVEQGMQIFEDDTIVGEVEIIETILEQSADATELQQLILEGFDPTEVAEAPAAGGETQGVEDSEGSTVVVLDRTNGETNPNAGYETIGLSYETDSQGDDPYSYTLDLDGGLDVLVLRPEDLLEEEWAPYEPEEPSNTPDTGADTVVDDVQPDGGTGDTGDNVDDVVPDEPDTEGQNPGNDKPVGNSPFDGTKGASNDDEGDEGPQADKLEIGDVLNEQTEEEVLPFDPPRGGPKGNNGWGNGDQEAPGNSGGNNNAENNLDGLLSPTEQYYEV